MSDLDLTASAAKTSSGRTLSLGVLPTSAGS